MLEAWNFVCERNLDPKKNSAQRKIFDPKKFYEPKNCLTEKKFRHKKIFRFKQIFLPKKFYQPKKMFDLRNWNRNCSLTVSAHCLQHHPRPNLGWRNNFQPYRPKKELITLMTYGNISLYLSQKNRFIPLTEISVYASHRNIGPSAQKIEAGHLYLSWLYSTKLFICILYITLRGKNGERKIKNTKNDPHAIKRILYDMGPLTQL